MDFSILLLISLNYHCNRINILIKIILKHQLLIKSKSMEYFNKIIARKTVDNVEKHKLNIFTLSVFFDVKISRTFIK